MILEAFKIGLANIKHKQIRAWLTILGIVIGIAAIVSLITLSQGMENAFNEQFSKMGVMDIRIAPKGSFTGPPVGAQGLTTRDVEVVEGINGVDYVLGTLIQPVFVTYDNDVLNANVVAYPTGLTSKAFADVDIGVADGRIIRKGDAKAAVIGHDIANELFDKDIRVKNTILIDDVKFRVIGILESTGVDMDDMIIIPLDDGREIFNKPVEVNAMIVHAKKGINLDDLSEDIERKLKRSRDNENFQVVTPQQILEQINSLLGVLNIVLVGIASISLIVGGLGIMNSMYTSVLERTKDIGVMKSTGATNNQILSIFLIESGLVGLVGGISGAVIGTSMAFGFGAIAKLAGFDLLLIKIDPKLLLFAFGFAFIVGVLSGSLPAYRASKLSPVDALRYE